MTNNKRLHFALVCTALQTFLYYKHNENKVNLYKIQHFFAVNTAQRVSCFGGGLLLVFNLVTVSGLARILVIAFVQEHQQGVRL